MKDIHHYLVQRLRTKVRAKSKIKEIAQQLYAIDKGMKAGFLWDVGCLQMDEVSDLINSLKHANLLQDTLVVVQIGAETADEFGVCRMNRFVGEQLRPVIIDVSEGHVEPRIADQRVATVCNGMLDLLKTQLEIIRSTDDPQSTPTVMWSLADGLCRTSAYGMFIGYPIVYWYNTELTQENCLSHVPLTVFQAGTKEHGNTPFSPLLSFSVPNVLLKEPTVNNAIALWKEHNASKDLDCITFSRVFSTVIM
uniref:Uncharacterized protein n=1 Tax=Anopheles epiroticus TaxID=199890 RepID=A0A240PN81_9DIPT